MIKDKRIVSKNKMNILNQQFLNHLLLSQEYISYKITRWHLLNNLKFINQLFPHIKGRKNNKYINLKRKVKVPNRVP